MPAKSSLAKPCCVCAIEFDVQCTSRFARAKYCSRRCQGKELARRFKNATKLPWSEIRKHLYGLQVKGINNPHWAGGVCRRADGYIQIYLGTFNGRPVYELEHRLIAASILGRALTRDETIHHINMNPSDNRKENLMICSRSYNTWLLKRYAEKFAEEYFDAK